MTAMIRLTMADGPATGVYVNADRIVYFETTEAAEHRTRLMLTNGGWAIDVREHADEIAKRIAAARRGDDD